MLKCIKDRKIRLTRLIFLLILKYNENHQYNTLMLQYFIAELTFFKYLYFPSTITDTSHIPSAITLAKHLST